MHYAHMCLLTRRAHLRRHALAPGAIASRRAPPGRLADRVLQFMAMDAHARADAIIRATLALGDTPIRVAYLRSLLREAPTFDLAPALDHVCTRAEQAEERAR